MGKKPLTTEVAELGELHRLLTGLFADYLDERAIEHQKNTPRFTDLPWMLQKDQKGDEYLCFTDDQNWRVNVPLSLIGPGKVEFSQKDQVFQLTDLIFAFVHYVEGAETPQFFLLSHYNLDNSHLMVQLYHNRAEIMALFRAEGDPEVLRAAEAMPYNFGSYSPNMVVVTPWAPQCVTNPFPGETDAAYKTRTADLIDPLQLKNLYEYMPWNLQQMLLGQNATLFGIMYFSTFYFRADHDDQNKIEYLHARYQGKQLSSAFLNAFGACELDLRTGHAVLQALEKPYGEQVLKRDEELFFIQQQFFSRHVEEVIRILSLHGSDKNWGEVLERMRTKVDKHVFRMVMARKRAELWKSAATSELAWDNFHPLTVFWGALFRAIASASTLSETSEGLELFFQDTKIQVIKGDPGFLRDPNDMENPENYLRPEEFGYVDYLFLKNNIESTYRKIDPVACDELIRRIPFDLMDPALTRLLIRKAGKIVAHSKIKPHVKNGKTVHNEYEFGNFYVEDALQRSYGLGQSMKDFVFAMVPEGATIVGQTSLLNPALELNIDLGWEVGREIVGLRDSLPFVETARHHSHAVYESKQKDRDEIRCQAMDTDFTFNDSLDRPINYFKADTSSQNTEQFGQFLTEFFKRDYVLTRIFYDHDENRMANLKSTYFVLEKSLASSS